VTSFITEKKGAARRPKAASVREKTRRERRSKGSLPQGRGTERRKIGRKEAKGPGIQKWKAAMLRETI